MLLGLILPLLMRHGKDPDEAVLQRVLLPLLISAPRATAGRLLAGKLAPREKQCIFLPILWICVISSYSSVLQRYLLTRREKLCLGSAVVIYCNPFKKPCPCLRLSVVCLLLCL